MIKQVTMYKTDDGRLFELYVDAQEHNLKLNRKALIDRMKFLEVEQRKDKLWLGNGFRNRENREVVQRRLDSRRREIRNLRRDLGFKDRSLEVRRSEFYR